MILSAGKKTSKQSTDSFQGKNTRNLSYVFARQYNEVSFPSDFLLGRGACRANQICWRGCRQGEGFQPAGVARFYASMVAGGIPVWWYFDLFSTVFLLYVDPFFRKKESAATWHLDIGRWTQPCPCFCTMRSMPLKGSKQWTIPLGMHSKQDSCARHSNKKPLDGKSVDLLVWVHASKIDNTKNTHTWFVRQTMSHLSESCPPNLPMAWPLRMCVPWCQRCCHLNCVGNSGFNTWPALYLAIGEPGMMLLKYQEMSSAVFQALQWDHDYYMMIWDNDNYKWG